MDTNQHCCPNCGGQQIALKKMLYYQGTSNTSGSYSGSYGGGSWGYDSDWNTYTGYNVGSQSGNYASVSQTTLAEYVGPPQRSRVTLLRLLWRYFLRLILIYVVIAILSSIIHKLLLSNLIEQKQMLNFLDPMARFGFLAIPIYAIFIFIKATIYNNITYPKLYRQWEKEWFCLSCGSAWTYE